MQNTAGFDGCLSPAAEMKWKASCSREQAAALIYPGHSQRAEQSLPLN